MRVAQVACWLAVVGLALVPTGCTNDAADAGGASGGSAGRSTTTAAQSEHSGHSPSTAPATTSAPPTRLDVVATEYDWTGLPDELPAGTYPVSFRNDGAEAHEISIFRNPDNIPLEQLFELGPEGIKGAVEMVGTLISGPGTAAGEELTATFTPGEYEVVCFIPAASDSQPHFTHGMHRKLLVW